MKMDESASPKRAAEQFDNSSAQAHFKRRRTALACNSCRTRKTRCNGERPSCVPCIELGLECIYENPANNNGKFQQPSYDDRLRSIEDTLRLLVHSREPSTQVVSEHVPPVPYQAATRSAANGERIVRLQNDEQDSIVNNEDTIDGMASIRDPGDSESRFYGPSSNIAFLRHLSRATSATLKAFDGGMLAPDQRSTQSLLSRAPSPVNTPSTTGPPERYQADPLVLPPEGQTTRLLELFFCETGLLFPFIQKEYVVSTYNHARSRGMIGVRKTFLCLLHAILAMAAHLDDDYTANPGDAEMFYQRAHTIQSSLDFKMTNVEIVQSLMIMIQYRQGTQKSDDTWVLLGRAVRIALQLGLHSRPNSSDMSPVECEVRKRVFHNCVMLDRVLSMTFGRPQTISSEFVRLDLPLNQDLDFLAASFQTPSRQNNAETPETVCFFNATIQLYDILDFILATIYDHNLSAESEIRLSEVLKHGLTVEEKLLHWRNNLPDRLNNRPWTEEPQTPSTHTVFDKLSVVIHLRYLNVSLLHHRAILDRFLDSLNGPEGQSLVMSIHDPFFLDFARHSLKVSQSAAMEIIDIVWKMSHRSAALGAWWFSAYYTFNASLVMYGCILVLFNLSKQDSYQANVSVPPDRHYKIERMISSLNMAVKVIERVGKGTRTAKGIRRTLIKIIQISSRLAQLHAAATNLGGQINGVNGTDDTQGNGVSNDNVVLDNANVAEMGHHQAWQNGVQFAGQWNVPDVQYWTAQTNFDIFGDLGSLDLGMGSFMAA